MRRRIAWAKKTRDEETKRREEVSRQPEEERLKDSRGKAETGRCGDQQTSG
jgi:hypothetical protein